jgi:UDP-N-acetylglucosamine 1-carboxyvinyltransferase
MEYIKINGKKRLQGTVKIAGAKNAALPIMMASILASETIILKNVPILSDIDNVIILLEDLGYFIDKKEEDIDAGTQIVKIIPVEKIHYEISSKVSSSMRASIWALGPMVAKHKKAIIPLPGGCKLGKRSIDMHIDALEKMGVTICIENDKIIAECKTRLDAISYDFVKISVGATANILMAACLANGISKLSNCAIEPEIIDLANFLNSIGAKISGIGTPNLEIEGVTILGGCEYTIISDRLEAGTYAIACAITHGEIIIENIDPNIMSNVLDCLNSIGVDINIKVNSIHVKSGGQFLSTNISTQPYPGFPTDMQAQISSLLSLAKGDSEIEENIFENRFMHIHELNKMGAKIDMINNQKWVIRGGRDMIGANLVASDLRGAASLVLAALGATGVSTIHNLEYLDRGYANLDNKLLKLGADITRIS